MPPISLMMRLRLGLLVTLRRRLLTFHGRSVARSLSQFAVHELEFTACQDLYSMQTAEGIENLPLTGLQFNVKYIDTDPRASGKTPVVVALHGIPGSHKDFLPVTDKLASRGVRVIVPNFPGYGWTGMDPGKRFKHTTQEKTFFLLDFLAALRVNRVDLLLAHSGGAYPGVNLCQLTTPTFLHGLVLVNPGAATQLKSFSAYTRLRMQLFAKLVRWWPFRPLLLAYLSYNMRRINYPIQDPLLMSVAIETIIRVNFEEFSEHAVALSLRGFPTSMIFSKDDRMVKEAASRFLAELLGGSEDNFIVHDSSGEPSTPLSQAQSSYSQCHLFENGGHFVMLKYPSATADIVFNLLKRVRQKQGFKDSPNS